MTEGIVYHDHPDLTAEENAEVREFIDSGINHEINHLFWESDPLPEKFRIFIRHAQDWMVKNWFEPLGIKRDDVHFPAYVRSKSLSENFSIAGRAESMSKIVYVDLQAIDSRIDDRDIVDFITARTIIEEMYHRTGIEHIWATVTQENGERSTEVASNSAGLSFFRKVETANAMEEGMAQEFAIAADNFLKTEFPEGYTKMKALETPEVAGQLLMYYKDNKTYWTALYPGPVLLAKEIITHGLGGNVGDLEQVRIYGSHLNVARKLKEVYGESVYRKVMTTSHNNAGVLATELESMRIKNSVMV